MKNVKRGKYKYLEVVIFHPWWAVNGKIVDKHPLKFGEAVLYLGEIPNVRGHCAVAKKDGDVIWLLHREDFRKATEDDL